MFKFKVGDRVRVKDIHEVWGPATVIETQEFLGTRSYHVRFDLGGGRWWYHESQLVSDDLELTRIMFGLK